MTHPRNLHPAALFGIVVVVAMLVRLLVLHQIKTDPHIDRIGGDGMAYIQWANSIAKGNWIGHEVFYASPLYPYLLAIFDKIVGLNLNSLLIAQAILGAIGCGLLALAVRKFFDSPTGMLAGLMLAFYPAAISYDLQVDKTVLDPLFTAGMLLCLAIIAKRPTKIAWLICGIVIGVFSLTRENALALLLPIILWAWWQFRAETRKNRAIWCVIFIAGVACVVFSVSLRNSLIAGEFHLTTAKFGPNFYYGNAAAADGIYFPLRLGRGDLRYEQIDATDLAEQSAGHRLTPAEVSSYWTHRTLDEIATDPFRWLKLSIKKFAMFWTSDEIADADVHDRHIVFSPVMRTLDNIWGFGVLFPLAAAGAVLIWKQNRSAVELLSILIIVYAIAIAAFILFGRYRLAVVPMLIPLAAAGVVNLHKINRSRLIAAIFIALVAIGIVRIGDHVIPDRIRGTNPYNRANIFASLGQNDLAISNYRKAIAQNPNLESAYVNLSRLLPPPEAEPLARRAIELNPQDAAAHVNLGIAIAQTGRMDQGMDEFKKALQFDPENRAAQYNLAAALLQTGKTNEAISLLKPLATTQPADEFSSRAQQLLKRIPAYN